MRKIEVVTGPMFCGKSEELIRRINRELIAKRKALVVKPVVDSRHPPGKVISHAGREIPAIVIDDPDDLRKYTEYDVIGIDEVQFFDIRLLSVVQFLNSHGVRIIVAGLDKDFLGEPFYLTCQLMGLAHRVDKLTSVCTVCGNDATETFLSKMGKYDIIDGNPVLIGDAGQYEARCKEHFGYLEE